MTASVSAGSAQVDLDRFEPRRRGKPLTADDRRAAIIEATTPLIAERGPSVTSAEIAEAAHIAQGTIFHVFGDKQALVDAVVQKAMDTTALVVELDGLVTEPDLRARLAAAIDRISAHMIKAMPVLMKCGKPKGGHDEPRVHALAMRDVVARLLEPDAATLAHPPAQMAAIVFGLCLASAQQTTFGEAQMPSSMDLAELFLDGARIRG